jgi:hypothetical protein
MVISANTKINKTDLMVPFVATEMRQNQSNNSAKNASFIAGA